MDEIARSVQEPVINVSEIPPNCSRNARFTWKLRRFQILELIDQILLVPIYPAGKDQHEQFKLQ